MSVSIPSKNSWSSPSTRVTHHRCYKNLTAGRHYGAPDQSRCKRVPPSQNLHVTGGTTAWLHRGHANNSPQTKHSGPLNREPVRAAGDGIHRRKQEAHLARWDGTFRDLQKQNPNFGRINMVPNYELRANKLAPDWTKLDYGVNMVRTELYFAIKRLTINSQNIPLCEWRLRAPPNSVGTPRHWQPRWSVTNRLVCCCCFDVVIIIIFNRLGVGSVSSKHKRW